MAQTLSTPLNPQPLHAAHDGMHFAMFIALAVHGILIFGLAFTPPPPPPPAASLEVTLASFKHDKAPDEADFIAQANQQGSGTLDEAALPSTTELADFQSNEAHVITPPKPQQKATSSPKSHNIITSRLSHQKEDALEDKPEEEAAEQTPETEWWSITERSKEIASLEAQLRESLQLHAKRPKIRQVTAASTRQSDDAEYLDAWRNKVEAIANQNYPQLGIDQLWGELRLMVAVNKNGTIHSIKLLESSGIEQLDKAALRIVRMAAPFDPFPPEMRKNTDILQIIRTWRNEAGRYVAEFE